MRDESPEKRRRENPCMMCCKIIFAIILPPIAVLLERGCGCVLCLNIVLTLLGWLPGMIHAFFVILGGDEYDHLEEDRRKEKKEKEGEKKKEEDKEKAVNETNNATSSNNTTSNNNTASNPANAASNNNTTSSPANTTGSASSDKSQAVIVIESPNKEVIPAS